MLAATASIAASGVRRSLIVGYQRGSSLRCAAALFSTSTPTGASSGNDDGATSTDSSGFRPRRRTPRTYRPLEARPKAKVPPRGPPNQSNTLISQKVKEKMLQEKPRDALEAEFGLDTAEAIRLLKRTQERGGGPDVEAQLRAVDYLVAPEGSTEDLVGDRRAAMDAWTEEERERFDKGLDELIEEERIRGLKLDDLAIKEEINTDENETGSRDREDPNQRAFGPWKETIIRVDRVQKVQRGGTMVRYRALVIGGNANGCAGFGIGKAASPAEATQVAIRMCKRNIFFIDRYQNSGLTSDLAGKHNSCRVLLRSTEPGVGLKGHDLILLILTYFGITDCSAKSHGNRNIYNVVRATFKAICTHESLEDIALKRGKRLMNLERAKRLQI